jgi:hypothetical protein
MMTRYAITGDRTILDRIETEIRANVGKPARDALWGSLGTALAALLLRERDGDDRYDDVLRLVQCNRHLYRSQLLVFENAHRA